MPHPALISLLSNPVALIGAASPFILNYIQSHKAALERQKAAREAVVARAAEAAREISTNADALLFFNREAMFGVVFRGLNICDENPELAGCEDDDSTKVTATDKKNWQSYQGELWKWNASTTSRQAQVMNLFGAAVRDKFDSLLVQLELLERMVGAAYFKRPKSRYFIEDLGELGVSVGQRNKAFLVDLFRLDREKNAELVEYLETEGGDKDVEKNLRTDFRFKYMPIHDHLKRELVEFGEMMLARMQAIA